MARAVTPRRRDIAPIPQNRQAVQAAPMFGWALNTGVDFLKQQVARRSPTTFEVLGSPGQPTWPTLQWPVSRGWPWVRELR